MDNSPFHTQRSPSRPCCYCIHKVMDFYNSDSRKLVPFQKYPQRHGSSYPHRATHSPILVPLLGKLPPPSSRPSTRSSPFGLQPAQSQLLPLRQQQACYTFQPSGTSHRLLVDRSPPLTSFPLLPAIATASHHVPDSHRLQAATTERLQP